MSRKNFSLSPQDLRDLREALDDARAYRVGDGDPNDITEPVDREGAARAERLARLFGVPLS